MMNTQRKVYDAMIIGGGPAGLSTALGLSRIARSTIVFDSGEYRNQGSTAMHTYLTRDGIHPSDFRAMARQEIQSKYSAYSTFSESKIVGVKNTEILPGYIGFEAIDNANKIYLSRKLVLASGSEDILPTNIQGYKENWAKHIHQCPFCDGFEHKEHPIGILSFASPTYAHIALMCRSLNPDVTVFSNGPVHTDADTRATLAKLRAAGVKIDERRIKRLINNGVGPENGITLEFEIGPPTTVGMLMHKPPTRSRALALIEQLGLKLTPQGDVELTDTTKLGTNVAGCIVAGDTQDMMKQAILAAATGVRAAAAVTMQLSGEEGEEALQKMLCVKDITGDAADLSSNATGEGKA